MESAGRLVNKLYCNDNPIKPWGRLGDEHNLMFGKATFGNYDVPVMTHNQFGRRNDIGQNLQMLGEIEEATKVLLVECRKKRMRTPSMGYQSHTVKPI